MNQLRVAVVSPYYAPAYVYGGPPASIAGLCESLRSLGTAVTVFTTNANGAEDFPDVGWQSRSGVDVRYFRRHFPKRYFASRELLSELRDRLREFDVIHVNGVWNVTSTFAASLCVRAGMPVVLSPRGMLEVGARRQGHSLLKRFSFEIGESRILRNVAALHATSESERATLESLFPDVRVQTIPNGIRLRPEDRKEFAPTAPHILYIGRIHPIKRLDLLAAAFLAVHKCLPAAALTIAGHGDEKYRAEIDRILAPVRDSVTWVGHVDPEEKQDLLSRSAVTVTCSDSESFGMAVVESLAAGVPVVVTQTCPWQVIEDRRCGAYVQQTPAGIAEGILRICHDEGTWRGMSRNARATARELFGWDHVAERMVDFYLSLRKEAAATPGR